MGWKEEDVDLTKPKTAIVEDITPNVTPVSNEEFLFDDEVYTGDNKVVFTVFGEKNDGKTTISYGIPDKGDKVLVFSFDNKSTRPLDAPYIVAGDLKVKPLNAIKYLDKSSAKTTLASAKITHNYILSMLRQAKEQFNPDWIMFDGSEVLNSIIELVMRADNNLAPYQGIANQSLWRFRKDMINNIHAKSKEIANKGLIYTMYTRQDEEIVDGATQKKVAVPAWVGSIKEESDMVIKAEIKIVDGKNSFYARMIGSKLPDKYPEGLYDVTRQRFIDVISKAAESQL